MKSGVQLHKRKDINEMLFSLNAMKSGVQPLMMQLLPPFCYLCLNAMKSGVQPLQQCFLFLLHLCLNAMKSGVQPEQVCHNDTCYDWFECDEERSANRTSYPYDVILPSLRLNAMKSGVQLYDFVKNPQIIKCLNAMKSGVFLNVEN